MQINLSLKKMKNLLIVPIIVCLSFFNALSQQSLKISKHGDTIIHFRVDTLKPKKRLGTPYNSDGATVNRFSKYFVNDVIKPGDQNHSIYRSYIQKANSSKEEAINKITIRVKKDPSLLKWTKLKDVNELKNCQLKVLPIYYLTHNVVSYSDERSFVNFFTLDTGRLNYQLMNKNKMVGVVTYHNGFAGFKNFNTADSLSYYQILSMHKTPFAFIRRIYDPESLANAPYDSFGYVSGGHLVFAICQQSNYEIRTPSGKFVKKELSKDSKLQSAESYYLGSDSTFATLPDIIKNGDKMLKYKEKLNPKN
jgi:hypothetical protein